MCIIEAHINMDKINIIYTKYDSLIFTKSKILIEIVNSKKPYTLN